MINFFLSYSNNDHNKIIAIDKAAQKKPYNFKPIIVAYSKKHGVPLTEKVKEGILSTPYFVPIITKNSINNQWVNQEIGFALASNKTILPIIEKNIINNLKGFIHNQIDLPFTYVSNITNSIKESYSFRKCYLELFKHLSIINKIIFDSKIRMKNNILEIRYSFKGNLLNGFFDNKVINLETGKHFWVIDPDTLDNSKSNTPGNLHGHQNIKDKLVNFSTVGLSLGKYRMFSRIYEHDIETNKRYVIAEKIHEFEIS